jgi:hypothetical protein
VVFVAGEAEVDEPLAVEGAGDSLQNFDAPLAVLDQFVVGRQDARDVLLDRKWRNREPKFFDQLAAKVPLSAPRRNFQ